MPVRVGEPSDAAVHRVDGPARFGDGGRSAAAERGHDRPALNVHIRNPAAHRYSRAGFVVAGKGRGPLGVAMVRELR